MSKTRSYYQRISQRQDVNWKAMDSLKPIYESAEFYDIEKADIMQTLVIALAGYVAPKHFQEAVQYARRSWFNNKFDRAFHCMVRDFKRRAA